MKIYRKVMEILMRRRVKSCRKMYFVIFDRASLQIPGNLYQYQLNGGCDESKQTFTQECQRLTHCRIDPVGPCHVVRLGSRWAHDDGQNRIWPTYSTRENRGGEAPGHSSQSQITKRHHTKTFGPGQEEAGRIQRPEQRLR